MKNKRVVGTAQPIEIDERFENHRFFQIATLIDRPNCLIDIGELRLKYLEHLLKIEPRKYSLENLPEKLKREAEFLPTKYFRPSSLEKAMVMAVVFGKITIDDYQPVKFQTFDTTNPYLYGKGLTMTIALDQFTTKSEVEKVFTDKFEEYRKGFIEYEPPELKLRLFTDLKEAKNITNVKRDRKWYWRNQSGESYAQIALSELNKEDREKQLRHDNSLTDVPGVESVKKAIQRYKKLITVDIYDHLT